MSVISFVQGLLPNFDRSRILEDIGQQREYIEDTLLPNLRNTAKVTGNHLKSPYGLQFSGTVAYALPGYKSRGTFNALAEYLAKINATIVLLEGLVPDMFNPDVTKETLSYQKAAVLKYLDSSRFIATYTSNALSAVLTAEAAATLQRDSEAVLAEQFTKYEQDYLTAYQQRFTDTLRALDHAPRDVVRAIEQIPDVTVDPGKEKILNQTVGLNKLDPLKLGFVPSEMNPIYTLQRFYVEFKHNLYKVGVEEARVLELKIQDLKCALDGREDVRLQKGLDYTKGRLDKLNAQLKDYEESGSLVTAAMGS